MASKVKCTCGWSWDKSDSSKKDMYICHECGRDNSNNIPKAQEGIQTLSSKDKRGTELLIKETENAKKDKHELLTTGQIKNPRSVAYISKVKKQPELRQDYRNNYEKEHDRKKGQKIEDKKQFKKNVIAPLDVATDIMQLGNFIPNPIAQTIGGIGNAAGMAIDAYQAYDDLSEGNYTDAAINAGSVLLPMGLDAKTFRRNSKYLQPGQPLYPFSPQANLPANASMSMRINAPQVNYIEPFTKVKGMTDTSLLANRALLGTLGAETVYDIPKQKNGGWLDNYNDSQASAPEGMEGDGFSNVGRNYSPAWGGSFQMGGSVYPVNYVPQAVMGGSLPGAVGFSYARTQGAAPSNGKYAKKTMASAQNGKEMQYYQNGLDYQPKTISKNGSWLSKYDVAQKGIKIPDERDEAIARRDVTPNFQPKIDKPLTAKQKEQIRLQKLRDKQGEIRTHTPQSTSSKIKEVALNPLTAFGYAARNESLPENFSRGERNTLDMATDIINPAFYLNQADEAGTNIGSSVSNIAQGNYPAAYRDIKNAGMNALNTLPLASEYKTIAKGAGQLGRALGTEEGLLSKVDNVIYPRRAYRASLPEGNVTSYVPSELASKISGKGDWATTDLPESFQYLSKRGLLSGEDMALTEYKVPFWKKDVTFDPDVVALKQSQNAVLNPSEYIIPGNNPIDKFLYPRRTNMIKAVPESVKEAELLTPGGMSYKSYDPNSIPMSYQAPNFSSPAYKYIEDQLNAVTGHKMPMTFEHNLQFESPRFNVPMDTYTQPTLPPNAGVGNFSRGKISTNIAPELRQGLRTASPSFNSSELFDLNNVRKPSGSIGNQGATSEGANKILQSLNIKVKGANPNEVTLKEMVEHLKNNPKDASKYKKFLEREPISVSELPGGEYHINDGHHRATLSYYSGNENIPTIIKNKGEYTKQKEGGIIKDDRGQWDHPGEITEISGDTMATHGYGNIPLYVVPDVGEARMVYPNTGTHTFPGATKFTEYPKGKKAQNGLRQEQKGLQNLDNLTNFTNYNKPQPGGWLNKYN